MTYFRILFDQNQNEKREKKHENAQNEQKISIVDFRLISFSILYSSLGSCLSYGHSCWGAHGKRSSNDRIDSEQQPADRWAMFKLMQDEVSPLKFRQIN